MTIKSASEQIHGVLAREARGFKFVASQLQQICKIAGLDVTSGAVTGFIFRAQQKGMIGQEAKRRGSGRGKAHMAIVYVLHDPKITWDFGAPSEGRQTGSLNVGTKPSTQAELPLEEAYLADHMNILRAVSGKDDPYADEPKEKGLLPGEGDFGTTTEITTLSIPTGGLADQLLDLAAKVGELEDRPVKSLNDFSVEEILEHLKTRIRN